MFSTYRPVSGGGGAVVPPDDGGAGGPFFVRASRVYIEFEPTLRIGGALAFLFIVPSIIFYALTMNIGAGLSCLVAVGCAVAYYIFFDLLRRLAHWLIGWAKRAADSIDARARDHWGETPPGVADVGHIVQPPPPVPPVPPPPTRLTSIAVVPSSSSSHDTLTKPKPMLGAQPSLYVQTTGRHAPSIRTH